MWKYNYVSNYKVWLNKRAEKFFQLAETAEGSVFRIDCSNAPIMKYEVFPSEFSRKWHRLRFTCRHKRTHPLCKLDLTAFHWLFIPACHMTISIFLVSRFYSMVNRWLLLRRGQIGDILTPNIKKTVGNDAKIYYRAMPRISFVHFLDVFTDPPPSVWPATQETGGTKGAHLATKKKIASEAGWHHTQTHGPVKVCEPGFGGNNDSVPHNGFWFPLHLLWLLCTWTASSHFPRLCCFARGLSSSRPKFK